MQERKVNLMTVVTLCVAVAAGAWALSTESHNYRLSNMTSRLDKHEDALIEGKATDADILRVQEVFMTESRGKWDDLAEIKADVKALLNK